MTRGDPTHTVTVDRGQTGVDFLIGIGIFLLTAGFVFGFVPGILVPFDGDQSAPLVSDRVADTLVDDYFVDRPGSVVLNETCTVAFFNASVVDGSGCGFDPSEPDLAARLGIDGGYRMNVTVVRNVPGNQTRARLYGDADGVTTDASGTTPLAVGDPVPAQGSISTATRLVHVGGQDAVVVVKLW